MKRLLVRLLRGLLAWLAPPAPPSSPTLPAPATAPQPGPAFQRAMVAARIKGVFEAEAKERMHAGRPKQGTANLPEVPRGEARERAAQAVNVAPRSVQSAQTVIDKGAPELVAAVDQGVSAEVRS